MTADTAVILGTGMLTWSRYERIGDRYGTVSLMVSPVRDDFASFTDTPPDGTVGTLAAEILETRQSAHIGDFARGIGPSTPTAGEIITLGSGALFREDEDGMPQIGLRPADGRETDWLDPRALYRCHSQTVRLIFTPEG